MPDITENDLLAAILAEYQTSHRRDGDVSAVDIQNALKAENPNVSYDVARAVWDKWALHDDLEILQVIDPKTNKRVRVLRKRNPTD
jgi:hypothetical protein